jgi:hypothetical protein
VTPPTDCLFGSDALDVLEQRFADERVDLVDLDSPFHPNACAYGAPQS